MAIRGPAFGHAKDIIAIEDALHLYVEPTVQQWYLDLPANGLIRLWNVYYGIAHFLVTFIALVWMFRRDPLRHRLLRNTLALTTGARRDRLRGLLAHAAPPARRPRRVRRLPDLRPGGGPRRARRAR